MITPSDLEIFGMQPYFERARKLRHLPCEQQECAFAALKNEADAALLKTLLTVGITSNDRLLAYGRALNVWLRETADMYVPLSGLQFVAEER